MLAIRGLVINGECQTDFKGESERKLTIDLYGSYEG